MAQLRRLQGEILNLKIAQFLIMTSVQLINFCNRFVPCPVTSTAALGDSTQLLHFVHRFHVNEEKTPLAHNYTSAYTTFSTCEHHPSKMQGHPCYKNKIKNKTRTKDDYNWAESKVSSATQSTKEANSWFSLLQKLWAKLNTYYISKNNVRKLIL